MDEDALAAILGPPNERLLAFEKVLHLAGDNAALIQAVTAYAALVRADERERCARLLETKASASTHNGSMLIDDDDPDVPRRLYAAAIRTQA